MRASGPAGRLDRFLSEQAPELTRSAAGRLARQGAVLVNGNPARPADQVRAGDVVEFRLPAPADLRPAAEQIPLAVLYEDEDLLVIDKPAGMVVHPAAGHFTGTLVHALLGRGGVWSTSGGEARPGIVHRLDRGTSGLIVAARTDRAHRELSGQLARKEMARTYQAIATGSIRGQSGVLEGAIGRHPRDRKRMAVVASGRFARTHYTVLEALRGHTLLRCELETGRTHQIRVHLAAFGHPVAGDREYGGGGLAPRPMLHAWRLRLRHPATGEELVFETPPPADFAEFLESLR
ncbi:MAG: RluA family pseudouridine synthase [Chloroflexi bacterium]|nr:MAG: RluA family pseudouridine synthase [Chloroflexota bacterium]TME14922.1 MAG: RluA family pseudouridine synthase [Chloroflexota bacterium]TME18006.1 MAG: RluA family pseudouridine synthase [Chloroflexota bacterium]